MTVVFESPVYSPTFVSVTPFVSNTLYDSTTSSL